MELDWLTRMLPSHGLRIRPKGTSGNALRLAEWCFPALYLFRLRERSLTRGMLLALGAFAVSLRLAGFPYIEKPARLAMADCGRAVGLLGHGGDGSLPGAPMEPLPRGRAHPALLRTDDSGHGAVSLGLLDNARIPAILRLRIFQQLPRGV